MDENAMNAQIAALQKGMGGGMGDEEVSEKEVNALLKDLFGPGGPKAEKKRERAGSDSDEELQRADPEAKRAFEEGLQAVKGAVAQDQARNADLAVAEYFRSCVLLAQAVQEDAFVMPEEARPGLVVNIVSYLDRAEALQCMAGEAQAAAGGVAMPEWPGDRKVGGYGCGCGCGCVCVCVCVRSVYSYGVARACL